MELPATATTRQLEPVRPCGAPGRAAGPEPGAAGRCDRALPASHGRRHRRAAGGRGPGDPVRVQRPVRLRPAPPAAVPAPGPAHRGGRGGSPSAARGMLGMAGVALLLAFGTSVASLPAVSPTQAIPRAAVARQAIEETHALMAEVDEKVDGHDLIDRAPETATELLNQAFAAIERRGGAGVPAVCAEPAARPRRRRAWTASTPWPASVRRARWSTWRRRSRVISPSAMVAASDGSLWVADTGRGRLVRDRRPRPRAGRLPRRPGDRRVGRRRPVAARHRRHRRGAGRSRSDRRGASTCSEQTPQPLSMPGLDEIGGRSQLLAALQHRPPLEIFNLYAVDARARPGAEVVSAVTLCRSSTRGRRSAS